MNFLFSSIIASVAEKNLPNGTETLGNSKTADYELHAIFNPAEKVTYPLDEKTKDRLERL